MTPRGTAGESATAFAPATVANVAVGFDLLGFAVEGAGDRVTARRIAESGVRIVKIAATTSGPDGANAQLEAAASDLPLDPGKNTASVGVEELFRELAPPFGVELSIEKGIALGSGMGGSAASAVAAVVAANAILPAPLKHAELLRFALTGEAVASGSRHADNVAPCLLGGLQLVRGVECTAIPVPPGILCVLVHPSLRVDTKDARRVLRADVALRDHIAQSGRLAGLIAGCFTGDTQLIGRCLDDILIEPQRAPLIRGFSQVKSAALAQGALGASISGSGPSVFAWVPAPLAERVRAAMVAAFAAEGAGPVRSWVSPISAQGARLL